MENKVRVKTGENTSKEEWLCYRNRVKLYCIFVYM